MGCGILVTVLAAWGLLCAIWAAAGWLLPGSAPVTVVVLWPGTKPEPVIARCRWLLGLGLLRGRLIVTGNPLPADPAIGNHVEICGLEELPARLELEREN
jgi:hypothetical protein